MTDIGALILSLRKSRGLTQSSLAQLIGVTDKAVSKWERGLSCPDISLLPELARALSVTVDELLSGEISEDGASGKEFISLEKYLMGDFNYYVPDLNLKNKRVLLLLDCPYTDEAQHGYALSARIGAEINRYLFGKNEPFTLTRLEEIELGVCYVSNVPLHNLEPPINKLVDELEYTRLNRYHLNRYLIESFIKKLEGVILDSKAEIIALTREFNQKYFGAFLSYASRKTLEEFFRKTEAGKLGILFVGPPSFWNSEDYKKPDGLELLKKALSTCDS